MGEAFGWGFIAASSLLLGGLLALRRPIGLRPLGLVMAFGSGVLISAVAYELVEDAFGTAGGSGAVGLGLLAGALAGLPGSSLDRAPHPGEPPWPTRGAGGPATLSEDPDARCWGARDRVFPQSQAREAVTHLPEGSLSLILECGHMPHVECPDRFLGALDGFLLKQVHR